LLREIKKIPWRGFEYSLISAILKQGKKSKNMIYLGADHGGYGLKNKIKEWLAEWDLEYQDLGNQQHDSTDDYPDFALKVAEKVSNGKDRGILACRSAVGMVITANKVPGVRAAAAFDVKSARQARNNDDANILALSGDWLDEDKAKEVLKAWLDTEFSGAERHIRRLNKIKEIEKQNG